MTQKWQKYIFYIIDSNIMANLSIKKTLIIQDLMEPKPIVELHTKKVTVGILLMNSNCFAIFFSGAF